MCVCVYAPTEHSDSLPAGPEGPVCLWQTRKAAPLNPNIYMISDSIISILAPPSAYITLIPFFALFRCPAEESLGVKDLLQLQWIRKSTGCATCSHQEPRGWGDCLVHGPVLCETGLLSFLWVVLQLGIQAIVHQLK